MRRISKCLGVGLAATAASAFAVSTSASAEDGADFIIELGAGVMVQPAWEGSDELLFSPYPIIAPRYISIGRFTIGGGPTRAFTLRPDINIRGERDDDDDLAGLDDVDFTFEAGAAVSYRYGPVKA
ncbi:MAG: MipA/OmpV family protein, partial [Pseudomonadota bacterium]